METQDDKNSYDDFFTGSQSACGSMREARSRRRVLEGKPYVGELGYAFMFRNYRADKGKWSTADPLGYPDGFNNLAYVNNGVINSFDWLGGLTYEFTSVGSGGSDSGTTFLVPISDSPTDLMRGRYSISVNVTSKSSTSITANISVTLSMRREKADGTIVSTYRSASASQSVTISLNSQTGTVSWNAKPLSSSGNTNDNKINSLGGMLIYDNRKQIYYIAPGYNITHTYGNESFSFIGGSFLVNFKVTGRE